FRSCFHSLTRLNRLLSVKIMFAFWCRPLLRFMVSILVALTFTCFQAHARNIKLPKRDNQSSDLMSLNYYAHEGILEVIPKASTAFHDDTKHDTGAIMTTTYNQIFFSMHYGLAPGWRVAVTENLLWDHLNNTITAAGVASNGTKTGLSNPTLTTSYRYL